jgi:hypothetical protein
MPVDAPQPGDVGRRAVDALREILATDRFAEITAVDRETGELIDPEARALFASLPRISPVSAPEELLQHGLIQELPHNMAAAFDSPKYKVGRQVFVRTYAPHAAAAPSGATATSRDLRFSHRASLLAQVDDRFRVQVDGVAEPLNFDRMDIFSWNEPFCLTKTTAEISGVRIDYDEPLWKAHICAGFVDAAAEIEELDFAATPLPKQQRIVRRLIGRMRTQYAGRGRGYAGPRAGALFGAGQGVCFVQRAVAGAYLQVFASVLALELQMAIGETLRLRVPHGFLIIMFRPSLQRFVCDPAWSEPLTDLRVAFHDAGWGHDRCLVGCEGEQVRVVPPHLIDLPGVAP